MKILLYDNGMPFTLGTPYEAPLGGSETSLLLLSKGLAELGHQVILMNSGTTPDRDRNRILEHNSAFGAAASLVDCILLNRTVPQEIGSWFGKKPVFLYCHDAYDQHLVSWMHDSNLVSLFTRVLCVSEWQRETFRKYLGVDSSKVDLLPNPIDPTFYYGASQRNLNKLLFASIPYKGLPVLGDLFEDLCVRTKRDDLELHLFSSMSLYGDPEGDRTYGQTYSRLQRTKGVTLHEPGSMWSMAREFLTGSLYVHPNSYHETFGMVLSQCQAGGCIPICTRKGAVPEVICPEVALTPGPNLEEPSTYEAFLGLCAQYLEGDQYKLRKRLQEWALQWDYVKVASRFLSLIEECNT